ncbi:MAG: carbohydrate ABC transporter permease [Anaerolineae bacterium]|nr:carbohydrate ABC transporter permease [Anaerolineae bacterium]
MTNQALTSNPKPFSFRLRRWAVNTGWYLVMIAFALVTALPFFWTALMSTRENSQNIFRPNKAPQLIPYPGLVGWGDGLSIAKEEGAYNVPFWEATEEQPAGWWRDYEPVNAARLEGSALEPYTFPATTENYYKVWHDVDLPRYFFNSIVVAGATVILNLITCSMAAYPLAKMKFRGRESVFYLILSTLIFPEQLTLIPLYIMAVQYFGFIDTLHGLILPFGTTSFGIFLLRQTYQSIPDELLEAARLDGASELRIWWGVLLPLIRPGLATLAIFTFVGSWNSFLWPLLMIKNKRYLFTLPVGLSFLRGFFSGNLRTIAAGVIIATVPIIIIFFIFQKQFIRGLSGAVKG